jgi:hypothetical protein
MAEGEDLEAVRAEVDRLRDEVEKLEARPQKRNRLRRTFTVVFVVLAVLAAAAITPGLWARRTVYDADRWAAVVTPLGTDPAIQEAVARQMTQAVFEALDVETRVQASLADAAPRLTFFAGPLTNAVQGFVQDQVQKILATPQFAQFWAQATSRLQSQVVAILNGTSEVLVVQGNQVVFNYLPLLNDALAQLSQTLSGVIGRQITLPTITADTVPSDAIAALQNALGVTLPPNFGSVVLFQSDSLTSVQDGVALFNKGLLLAVIVFILSVVLALVLSPNRRRTLLILAAALIVVVVLERRFAIAESNHVVSLAQPENQAAARAIIDAFLGSLLLSTKRILWVLFAILVIALLTGPYPWAVRSRAWVVDVTRAGVGAMRGRDLGPATVWIGAHRDVLMFAGAVLGALILLFASLSVGWLLVWLLVIGAYELAVYRVATSIGPPADAA